MDYYKTFFIRYLASDERTRTESREHWQKCHIENVRAGREDLIIFSAKILAAIQVADAALKARSRLMSI